MIQKIKNWFNNYREKRRRKQILKIIKEAKRVYLDGRSLFMCDCFCFVKDSFYCYDDIVCEISEFKPSTFGVDVYSIKGGWWPIGDRVSRIKAFDELIEIYSK
jgi:hypothetical protein